MYNIYFMRNFALLFACLSFVVLLCCCVFLYCVVIRYNVTTLHIVVVS